MNDHSARLARRVPVSADEPLIGTGRFDYADAFEIDLPKGDERSAEEFARCALEQAPGGIRVSVRTVHRHVLRLRLGPRSSQEHVLGWRIAVSKPDVLQLEAVSPLLGRAVLIVRRPDPTRLSVTTYLFHTRQTVGRFVWTVVGPLHRLIAPYLLEHATTAAHGGPR